MRITIEYASEILGNAVFWEGDEKDIKQIRNIPAQMVARAVLRSGGEEKKFGMWIGFETKATP